MSEPTSVAEEHSYMSVDHVSYNHSFIINSDSKKNLKDKQIYMIAKEMLESGQWDYFFPKFEKNILKLALKSRKSWDLFLSSPQITLIQSSEEIIFSSIHSSQSISSLPATTPNPKKTIPAKSSLQKSGTRSKKGSSTSKKRTEPEIIETSLNEPKSEQKVYSNDELLETLQTRVITLVYDTIVDQVIYSEEKYPNRMYFDEKLKNGS